MDENVTVKEEEIVNTESVISSCEHDYYTSETELPVDVDIKPEIEDFKCILLDHTYCLPHSSDTNLLHGIKQEEEESKTTEEIICDLKSDLLINGNSVFKNNTIKQLIPRLLSKDTHVKVLRIMSKDGKTMIISSKTNKNESIDYNMYKINIPVDKFKCVLEILPFLFRRLPLITNLADNLNYKCRYPYVAKDLNEYCSWNVGKRRSSEVICFLQQEHIVTIIIVFFFGFSGDERKPF